MQFKELRTSYENQGTQANLGITGQPSSPSPAPSWHCWCQPVEKSSARVHFSREKTGGQELRSLWDGEPSTFCSGDHVKEETPHSLQTVGSLFCYKHLDQQSLTVVLREGCLECVGGEVGGGQRLGRCRLTQPTWAVATARTGATLGSTTRERAREGRGWSPQP